MDATTTLDTPYQDGTSFFQQFPSRRSPVYGIKGVVACSQPLAAEAGLDILRKGGNAADAAVAVSAALNVTEPSCCGIGGDAFCLFYEASTKSIKALNGSGRSPEALTIEYLRSRGIQGSSIPPTNLNSVTVPGAAAAWVDVVSCFGSGQLELKDVLAPAIALAEEGVPVSDLNSHAWRRAETLLKNASPNSSAMLLNGKAPRAGEVMKFPDLARTFKELSEHGKDGFYKGRVAQATVDLITEGGGVLSLRDLANHKSDFVQPIAYTYKDDIRVYECPPNGQGLTALMALGILDNLQELGRIRPLDSMTHNSAEYLHALIESLRIAFADTRYYVADPEKEHVPVEELLSKEYLSSRAGLFDPLTSNPNIRHGYPTHSSDTVYFSITDQAGNGCSFIQSNYAGFGTGAIPVGCGFTLQNRGSGFSLVDGHPNALKPSKRPYHTIIPALVTRQNELFMVYGVMGGFMQPQGHVQVLLNILRGFTVQAALDAPRFCISAGLPDAEVSESEASMVGDANADIYLEEGICISAIQRLREMGHNVREVYGFSRSIMGRGQIIQNINIRGHKPVWAAGSDPRADGHAVAQI